MSYNFSKLSQLILSNMLHIELFLVLIFVKISTNFIFTGRHFSCYVFITTNYLNVKIHKHIFQNTLLNHFIWFIYFAETFCHYQNDLHCNDLHLIAAILLTVYAFKKLSFFIILILLRL